MTNKDELIYKTEAVIEYLKNNNGYNYKLYNHLCPGYGDPDSNIVEYAEDILDIINELINVIDKQIKQCFICIKIIIT